MHLSVARLQVVQILGDWARAARSFERATHTAKCSCHVLVGSQVATMWQYLHLRGKVSSRGAEPVDRAGDRTFAVVFYRRVMGGVEKRDSHRTAPGVPWWYCEGAASGTVVNTAAARVTTGCLVSKDAVMLAESWRNI